MGVQSYTLNELIDLLLSGKVENFRYGNYYATTYLNDDAEILFDLKDGKIPSDIINIAVEVLKNLDKCVKDAQSWLNDMKHKDGMYSDAFDSGFELYGITFGEFGYGHQQKPLTYGFTITFRTVNYYPCIFSVKYHKNMHPFAIEEYVE